jgi:hypothetical protein
MSTRPTFFASTIVLALVLVSDPPTTRAIASTPQGGRTLPPPVLNAAVVLLKDLRVSPSVIAGGNVASGTVELREAPPAGGVAVTLASSNTDLGTVPGQVTVSQGTASADTGTMYIARFPITTRAVSQQSAVTITARAGGQTLQASLSIRPPWPSQASLDLTKHCYGDAKVAFELDGPAPSGGQDVRVTIFMQTANAQTERVRVSGGNRSGTARLALPVCRASAAPSGICTVRASVTSMNGDSQIGQQKDAGGVCEAVSN